MIVGSAMGILVLFCAIGISALTLIRPKSLLDRAKTIKRFESETRAQEILGKADDCNEFFAKTIDGSDERACYWHDKLNTVRVISLQGKIIYVDSRVASTLPDDWDATTSYDPVQANDAAP